MPSVNRRRNSNPVDRHTGYDCDLLYCRDGGILMYSSRNGRSNARSNSTTVLIAILAAVVLVSCGDTDRTESREVSVTEAPEPEPAPAPAPVPSGAIAFVTGDAWVGGNDEEWRPARIGEAVKPGESVRVDIGYLELELEDIGVVRILEGGTLTLENLDTAPQAPAVDLRVTTGTILNKVNRIAGTGSYEVRTETAVMGVRGTEFLVRVGAGSDTTVAVQTGRVAILPVAADPDRIRARTAENPAAAEAIERVARQLADTAPVIEGGQELTVDLALAEESALRMAEVDAIVEEVLRSTTEETPVPEVLSERLNTAGSTAIESISQASVERVREVSPESQAELDLIDVPAENLGPAPEPAPEPESEPDPGAAVSSSDAAPPEPIAAETTSAEAAETQRSSPERPAPERAAPEPATVQLRITTVPGDASIEVDGRLVGTGRASIDVPAGSSLSVVARRAGFGEARQRITAGASGAERALRLELEPRPIEASISVTPTVIVRGLVAAGDRVFGADRNGTVFSLDGERVRWSVTTANGGNENSRPAVAGGRVAFSGVGELVVVSAGDGRVIARRSLSGPESHLFGRRAAPWGEGWVFPSDAELLILTGDGREERRIALPVESKMSPTILGARAIIADQQGTVTAIDLNDGRVISRVSTGVLQPIAQAPAVSGSVAVMMGRRGVASAVDTGTGALVWERDVGGGTGSYTDPVIVGNLVFFLIDREIVAVSLTDGAERYRLADAAGNVVSTRGEIYYATSGGELRRIAAATGLVTATLALPAGGHGTPAALGPRLAVPMEDGRVLWVHTEGIR